MWTRIRREKKSEINSIRTENEKWNKKKKDKPIT